VDLCSSLKLIELTKGGNRDSKIPFESHLLGFDIADCWKVIYFSCKVSFLEIERVLKFSLKILYSPSSLSIKDIR
jgi:hypothetical protein